MKREHLVGELYAQMLFTDVYRNYVIYKNIYVRSRQKMTDMVLNELHVNI